MVDTETPLPYGDPGAGAGLPAPPPRPPPSVPLDPATLPYPAYPVAEQVIAQIGEIQVTSTTVRTPAGRFPLPGSHWTVTDQWVGTQKIPTWAIVLAIVLIPCTGALSLLFLLAPAQQST